MELYVIYQTASELVGLILVHSWFSDSNLYRYVDWYVLFHRLLQWKRVKFVTTYSLINGSNLYSKIAAINGDDTIDVRNKSTALYMQRKLRIVYQKYIHTYDKGCNLSVIILSIHYWIF